MLDIYSSEYTGITTKRKKDKSGEILGAFFLPFFFLFSLKYRYDTCTSMIQGIGMKFSHPFIKK